MVTDSRYELCCLSRTADVAVVHLHFKAQLLPIAAAIFAPPFHI